MSAHLWEAKYLKSMFEDWSGGVVKYQIICYKMQVSFNFASENLATVHQSYNTICEWEQIFHWKEVQKVEGMSLQIFSVWAVAC